LLVSVVVAVDTLFFTALTPLIPQFADKYDLSKAGAGVLVSAYAAGTLVGALPGGLATIRLGPKRTVLIGLTLMTAASLGFALAGDVWTLEMSRFFQGVGSSCSWAGGLAWVIGSTPRERRGELIGTTMGAAVFGALLGPVLGALAGVVGTRSAFLGVTAAGAALVAWAATMPAIAPERQRLRAGLAGLRERSLVVGLWLIALPALLFGVLVVLVPLELNQHGWGSLAIGALFVATTAIETALKPAARPADRPARPCGAASRRVARIGRRLPRTGRRTRSSVDRTAGAGGRDHLWGLLHARHGADLARRRAGRGRTGAGLRPHERLLGRRRAGRPGGRRRARRRSR
jgi:MFS family permease